jgi:hypothetical protein
MIGRIKSLGDPRVVTLILVTGVGILYYLLR